MAWLGRIRWRKVLTRVIIVAVAVLVLSLEPTHILIMAFTPEPFRSLPIEWSRVRVSYEVHVIFNAPPRHAVVLVPAPTLDGHEIPEVTKDIEEREPGVTVVADERGVFYRMTEEAIVLGGIVHFTDVKIGERPKRWLFWNNPLKERFDLGRGTSPDGSRGCWFYVDSDAPVRLVTIRAYLDTAYTLYSDSTLDNMEFRLRYPPQGWSLMKEESGP